MRLNDFFYLCLGSASLPLFPSAFLGFGALNKTLLFVRSHNIVGNSLTITRFKLICEPVMLELCERGNLGAHSDGVLRVM